MASGHATFPLQGGRFEGRVWEAAPREKKVQSSTKTAPPEGGKAPVRVKKAPWTWGPGRRGGRGIYL